MSLITSMWMLIWPLNEVFIFSHPERIFVVTFYFRMGTLQILRNYEYLNGPLLWSQLPNFNFLRIINCLKQFPCQINQLLTHFWGTIPDLLTPNSYCCSCLKNSLRALEFLNKWNTSWWCVKHVFVLTTRGLWSIYMIFQ